MSDFLEDQANYYIKGSIGEGDENCRYLITVGESILVGGPNPDPGSGVFTAILDGGSGGTNYGFQPEGQANYLNSQEQVTSGGEEFWIALADVSQPTYFLLKPIEGLDDGFKVCNVLDNNLRMTMGADEGLPVLFETRSDENKTKQKWVFVKRVGSDPDIPGSKY